MKKIYKTLILLAAFFLGVMNANAQDTLLYGMTFEGGTTGQGTLFHYKESTHVLTTDFSFVNGSLGATPTGSLILATNGKLYGMSDALGANHVLVLFEFDPTTGVATNITSNLFPHSQCEPYGSLFQAPNGLIYGCASDNFTNPSVFFSLDPSTNAQTLIANIGGNTFISLMQGLATNGLIYGMTSTSIFDYNISTNSVTNNLAIFNSTTGTSPVGKLIQASDGLLYGMTSAGGTHSSGTIFSFNPSTNVLTVVFNFPNDNPFTLAASELMQASNGLLYGMTERAGISQNGTLFSFNTITDSMSVLVNFNSSTGEEPLGSLMQAANGKLYGMTSSSGSHGLGTLFEYNIASNTLTPDVSFNGTNGQSPTHNNLIEVISNPCSGNFSPVITASGDTTFCSGGSVTLDATGSFTSYLWSTGATTETITVSTSGTYAVTVTNANNCTGTASISTAVNPNPTPAITGDSIICSDNSTTLDAGTFPTYSWSTGETTENITVSTNNTYTVTVTDANGCIGAASQIVTVNPSPTPVIIGNVPFCQGGSIVLDAGPWSSFAWSDGETTETIIVSTGGTYSVTVTDNNGCTGTTSQEVIENSIPVITILTPLTICEGDTSIINVTNSSSGDNFDDAIPINFSGQPIYFFFTIDGCLGISTQFVNSIATPTPDITVDGSTSFCTGGSVVLDAGVYSSYIWSDGTTSETDDITTQGTYAVTVTNSNGCSGTSSQTVTVNPSPTLTISGITTSCDSVTLIATATNSTTINIAVPCTGFNADVIANGSNTSLNSTNNDVDGLGFVWVSQDFNPGGSTFCASGSDGLPLNGTITSTQGTGITYTLQNYDSNNDLRITNGNSNTLTLTTPILASGLFVVCEGGSGSLTFTPTINYADGSSTTLSAVSVGDWCGGISNKLTAQQYYRIESSSDTSCDGTDCQYLFEVSITGVGTSSPVSSITFLNNGNGILNIYALGAATLSQSFTWSGGNSPGNASNTFTSSGTYTVTVNEGNGCTGTASQVVTIANPAPVITGNSSICSGNSTTLDAGSFTSYNWSTGDTTENITVSTSGTFTVTVTNGTNCTGTASRTVTVNANPNPSITGNSSICSGNSTTLDAGSFTSYNWSTGASTETITVSTSGTFTVTVTNGNNCTGTASRTVTVNANPNPSITGNSSICSGNSTILDAGSFISYNWSTGASNETITVSTSGTFTVTVTNGNNCTGTASKTVTVNANPTPVITGNSSICSGNSTTLDAGSFTSYNWSTGASTETITVSTSGTFTVTVTNGNNCSGTASKTVTVNANPTPSITGGPITFCFDATIDLSVGSFASYHWSNGSSNQSIFADVQTTQTFSVTVTDGNGCTGVASQLITVNPNPTPVITGNSSICSGNSTILDAGSFTSYNWSTGASTETITVSTSGAFTVTVTNGNNCTGTASKTVTVNANLTPLITGDSNICNGNSTTLDAGSFTSYNWSTGASTETVTVSTSGTFTVTVTNGNNCTGTASKTITVNANPTPAITGNSSICSGNSTTLDAGSFTSYNWSTGASTETITVSTSGTFTVTVTNGNNCTGTASQTVTVNTNPTPTITGNSSICSGNSTTLDAGSFISYNWSTGATTETITVSTSGTFTVTVTNGNNCTGTASKTITVNANPTPTITGNSSICSGNSTTLDAGSFTSYNWSTGASTETITVSTSGTFTVTVTNGNNCIGTASKTITVNANPTPAITGNSSICSGNSTTLDAGSFTSYNWSTGASTETITVSTSGTFTVTVTNGNNCTGTASRTVTVNANPNPVITPNGPITFNTGDSVGLDAGSFASYNWSTGATTESIEVNAGGTFTVTVTNGNGCTGVASIVVTVTNSNGPNAYITNNGSNTVSVINLATNTVTATIPVGHSPLGVSVSHDGAKVYITNINDNTVSVINTATNGVFTITVGSQPNAIDVSPDGSKVYVTNIGSNTVSVINTATLTVSAIVAVGNDPCGIVVSPDGSKVYVANAGNNTVSVINTITNTVSNTISVGTNPRGICVSPDGSKVFVTIAGNNIVSVINTITNTVSNTITVGTNPNGICVSPDGSKVYVANFNVNTVSIINADFNFVLATIAVGANPEGVSVSPDGSMVYVAISGFNTVSAINTTTNTIFTTIAVGSDPFAFGNFITSPPPQPGAITGNSNVCQGSSQTYSIAPVTGATSYTWTLPSGWTGTSTSTSINTTVGTAGGTINVTANNSIGSSAASTKAIAVSTTIPSQPGTINGNASVCHSSSQTYSIVAVTGATSYSWTLPSGWSGSSTTTSITVTSGTSNGTISVTANNGCGNSAASVLSVTVIASPTPLITGNSSICSGNSTTLDAGSFTSYNWSTGDTTENITVSTSGTFTVTVTNGTNCTGTASRTVTVNANPNPSITGNSSICSGNSTTLDAGSFTSYNWSTGASTETITVSTSGTFTVTVTNGNNCTGTASRTVTVNANPNPSITGNSSICSGNSTILDAGSFISYNWSTGASNETITVSTSGTFTVTVTNGNNCTGTASKTVTVNANPTPVITGNSSICSGNSTTLDAGSFTSYNWSTGASTETITVSTSGTFTVTVTNGNNCSGTASKTVTVNANPTPAITGNSSICSGNSTTLNAGSFSSYSWSTGASTETITVSTNGTFTVTVTNANNCTGTASKTVTVNANPTPVITPNGPITFNAGDSVGLDAGSFTSYQWSTGATAESIEVSTSGSFTVTVTNGNGCTGVASIVVTVTNINGPNAYITDSGSNIVSVINIATNTVISTITVGNHPQGVSVSHDGSKAYITNFNSHSVSVVNTATNTVSATIQVGSQPYGIDVNPDGTKVYVANNSNDNSVSVINTATNTVSATISIGSLPGGIVVSPDGSKVYVTNSGSNTISVINTATNIVSATITVGSKPDCIAINPDGSKVYVGNAGGEHTPDSTISVINTGTNAVSATITVGARPLALAVSPDGSKVYVTNYGSNSVSVINTATNTISSTIAVGVLPEGISLNPDGSKVYVAISSSNTVSVINTATNTVFTTIAVGPVPIAFGNFITSPPPQPGAITGNANVCQGSSQTYSIALVTGATSYTWTLPSGWTGTSTTTSINTIAGTTGGTISVTANNSIGSSTASTKAIAVTTATPSQPGTISGNTNVCHASTQTYSIAAITGTTSYTWTLPSGWSGTSTTTIIHTTVGTGSDTISVTANNICGSSIASVLPVTVNSGVPVQPGVITGNTTICDNSGQTYSIAAVSGATIYTWTLPSGWTGTSTTTSISVTPGTTGGNISVKASNACGTGIARTLAVSIGSIPAEPGSIFGANTVCSGSTHTYSIAVVSGATSYIWSIPNGWTGTSTTTSITVTTGVSSGNILVLAVNGCGISNSASTLAVNVIATPSQPGAISGDIVPCTGTVQTYSVTAVNEATGYTWTLPSGWSGTSGQISIVSTVGSSSGTITVAANNACGSSSPVSLSVTVGVPNQPGAINGATAICPGTAQTYSVTPVTGALSYIWTKPSGWSGTSTTNSIILTANSTSGDITVKATNNCGSGTARALAITVHSLTVVTITGNPTNGNFCSQVSPTSEVLMASSGYNSYSWSPNGGNSQTATVNSANVYVVLATNSSGCTTTASKTVTNICALPTSLNTGVILGTSARANWVASQCAVNYTVRLSRHGLNSWTNHTVTSSPFTFTGLSLSTSYDWQVETNCNTGGSINSGFSATQTFTTASSRTKEEEGTEVTLNIYPNPADALVTIAFSTMEEGVYNVKLVDLMGRVVKSELGNAGLGDNTYIMNLDGVAKGVYMVIMQHGDNISKGKLVVE